MNQTTESAVGIYSDSWTAPRRHALDTQSDLVIESGVRGVALIRLLITDDSGYDRLTAEVGGHWHGAIFVLEQATRSAEFLRTQPGWQSSHAEMAMILRDVTAVPEAVLPDGLVVRPVNFSGAELPGGIPLRDAVTVAIASDPSIIDSADGVARFLSGLPASVGVFGAVDEGGAVRATSACHVFGDYTGIFFVNTQPEWRRRGIGFAMTLHALRFAASRGAKRAILHATADGLPVYRRIGFEDVGMMARFSYAPEPDA